MEVTIVGHGYVGVTATCLGAVFDLSLRLGELEVLAGSQGVAW